MPTPSNTPHRVEIAGFEEAYERQNAQLVVERSRYLILVSIVLYASFWLLDALVAPEFKVEFLAYRAAALMVFLAVLLVLKTPRAERLATPAMIVGAFAASVGISLMSARLGGFSSNYFVGNVIVIYVMGFFMPWGVVASSILASLVTLGYLAINLWWHGPSPEMVAPSFFLAGTGVFAFLAALSNRRTRRRDLALRLRLEKANEELKELDQAKTRFFANVSHELRTPLTLLLGPLDSMRVEEQDPERRELFESMETNAHRLLRQVDALLDLAKVEAGRLRLDPREGSLGELLAELVAATEPLAQQRGIRLTTTGLEDLPDWVFDHRKVEIVAANLLSNAVKFTPAGGRIEVRAEAKQDVLVFEVEDDGPGIPESQQKLIFERFHRVEDASSKGKEGSGLGLALARELTVLHGGTIAVTSLLGQGATFRVELPREPRDEFIERRRRARRKEDQLALARSEIEVARDYASRSHRGTLLADVEMPSLSDEKQPAAVAPEGAPLVLIVEDNSDLRNFLAGRLARVYRVATAADGVAGLEAARRETPDLVVADVMMPRMDGLELCRQWRADPDLAPSPFILLTAKASSEALVEGLEVGADDYVTKPFLMRELEARIAAHLRARHTERQLHERESRLAAIGQMTNSVVHDLRNPLTLIKGYTDLARERAGSGGDPEAITRELDQLAGATNRLRRMIEEILDFSRSGVGQLALTPTPAAKFLEHAMASLGTDIEKRGLACETDIQVSSQLHVAMNQDAMRRVIENLVRNAREACQSESRQGRIFFSAWVVGGALVFRVADNGPGLPADIRDSLFEPFATSSKRYGTGLGLMTVRNLVKAHSGEIDAESTTPEGGAGFVIKVPLQGPNGTGAETDAPPLD